MWAASRNAFRKFVDVWKIQKLYIRVRSMTAYKYCNIAHNDAKRVCLGCSGVQGAQPPPGFRGAEHPGGGSKGAEPPQWQGSRPPAPVDTLVMESMNRHQIMIILEWKQVSTARRRSEIGFRFILALWTHFGFTWRSPCCRAGTENNLGPSSDRVERETATKSWYQLSSWHGHISSYYRFRRAWW